MQGNAIPDNLRRFLLVSRLTVPHVEAVLLMRSENDNAWNSTRLASRLYLSQSRAGEILGDLAGLKILESTLSSDAYSYRPVDEALAQVVDILADCYARHLVEVTKLIHTASDPTAERFAAAFRFKKDA